MIRQLIPRLKQGGLVAFLVILFGGINLFTSFFGLYNFDLTSRKTYSLSPVTREVLSHLNDQLTVKVYISSSLPARFLPIKNYVLTTLWRIERLSKGKIHLELIDPQKDPKKAEEAKNYGLPEVEFTVISNDQYQTKKGYFGLVMLFTDRTAIIPVFNQGSTFEYEFMRRLLKITRDKEPKLYLAVGHGESFRNSRRFYQELKKEYRLTDLDLTKETELLKNGTTSAKAILIYSPTTKWKVEEVKGIQNWLEKGKNLIIFADPLSLDAQFNPHFNCSNINTLLAPLGVTLKKKLIFSPSGEVISLNLPNSPLAILRYYGFWFKLKPKDINPQLGWKNDLIGTTLSWAGSLQASASATPLVKVQEINQVNCPLNIQPGAIKFDESKKSTATVALLVGKKGKILIFADGDFVNDNYLSRYPHNLSTALDMIDLLAFDPRLLQLRAKKINPQLLPSFAPADRERYKLMMIGLPIGVIIVFSGIVALIEKKTRPKLRGTDA